MAVERYVLKRFIKILCLFLLVFYLLPVGGALVWWYCKDRPTSYRTANWGASGVLPKPQTDQAAIYVLAARTGGMKGAVSIHSWLVLKKTGENSYQCYDVVGWGKALRKNAYAADAYWYSNKPYIVHKVEGAEADRLIPKIENAISHYPYGNAGDYHIFPGPNSNSFVASILRDVPELNVILPSLAIGRDYLNQGRLIMVDKDHYNLNFSVKGFAGFSIGLQSGIELNLGGLVAGLDINPPGIKLPGIGRIGL